MDKKIRDKKLQYDINRKAAKISALSTNETHKYECLTGREILSSDQSQIAQKPKPTLFLLGKTFEK